MKELSLLNTQKAIKDCKDMFIGALSQELDLSRVSAPLFVSKDSGFNDNLNGVERPVTFRYKRERSCCRGRAFACQVEEICIKKVRL